MTCRFLLPAVLGLSLALGSVHARADCLWDVGMAERELAWIERAAPLATDRSLPLGPGTPDRLSGSDRDFAERARQAYGAWQAPAEETAATAGIIEGRLVWARNRLEQARNHAARGDMAACAAALDQARNAISGARAAFRGAG